MLLYSEAGLRGALERKCFEFYIQSSWQKHAGGVFLEGLQGTSLQP